jgi:hypothetical protein
VRLYNIYIILLAAIFMLTTIVLSLSKASLDLYFSMYLIEYLVLTLLFTYLNPRARRILNFAGYVLFAGFTVIVALKVVDILLP